MTTRTMTREEFEKAQAEQSSSEEQRPGALRAIGRGALDIAKDPIELLVRSAARTGQAVGALGVEAFGTEEMKQRGREHLDQDQRFMGMDIPSVTSGTDSENFKQIAGEGLRSASYLGGAGLAKATVGNLGLPYQGIGNVLSQGAQTTAIGAGTGGAYGVGEALERDASAQDVAVQGAIGAGVGAAAAGGLAWAIPQMAKGTLGAYNKVSETIRNTTKQLPPEMREQMVTPAVQNLYRSVFERGTSSMQDQLGNQVTRSIRDGGPTDESALLRELIDEGGYYPRLTPTGDQVPGTSVNFSRSDRLDMSMELQDISRRISYKAEELDLAVRNANMTAEPVPVERFIEDTIEYARLDMENVPGIQFREVEDGIRQAVTNFATRHGTRNEAGELVPVEQLNLEQLNMLRREVNDATGAYASEFHPDALSVISNRSRDTLMEAVPDTQTGNQIDQLLQEQHQLFRMSRTANMIDGSTAEVPQLIQGGGRLFGTVAGSALGVSGALGGITGGVASPMAGGLVIAGILAGFGSAGSAMIFRNMKFNDPTRQILRKQLNENPDIADALKSASPRDRSFWANEARLGGEDSAARTPMQEQIQQQSSQQRPDQPMTGVGEIDADAF